MVDGPVAEHELVLFKALRCGQWTPQIQSRSVDFGQIDHLFVQESDFSPRLTTAPP